MGRSFFKAILLGATLVSSVYSPAYSQGLAGPYLAGSRAFDYGSFDIAAGYFVKAMAVDPSNQALKQRALISFIAAGDFKTAANIASAMRSSGNADIFVNLVSLVDMSAKGDYEAAFELLPTDSDLLSPMLWGLLNAWLKVGAGNDTEGLAAFDLMSENEAITLLGNYHKGLAQAYMGNLEAAAEILNGNEDGPLHLNRDSVVAHVEILSELGKNDAALEVLEGAIQRGFRDEQLFNLHKHLSDGKSLEFSVVNSPSYGMAVAFVTMAEAMSRGEPDRTALFYARLAQHLRPEMENAALVIAKNFEFEGQHSLAEEAYGSIDASSPIYKEAEIGRAEVLRAAGDTDAAISVLVDLVKEFPQDILVLNALGDVYRGIEKYEEAAKAYTSAIDNIKEFSPQHWVLFYTRGISFERLKDWPAAEADFRFALELSPDQPFVLNYLGYSFVEMGINFEEAQEMIETAVAGMPDNGYITDSLAWVLYRIGKFEEAVEPMERAVELLPVDPIINDHLGDVFWMVGRKREAEFQWRRAMSFNPTEEDRKRIKRKLEVGLDVVLEEEAAE